MSTVDIRAEVHQMIDKADHVLLEAIYAMLEVYKKHKAEQTVIGYEEDGTPITAAALEEQAAEAITQIKQGNYTSLEELERESEQWLKPTK